MICGDDGYKRRKLKEADMFMPIKKHLEAQGYEVFAEVPDGYKTVDIIAKKGGLYTVIETKTSMNLRLLEQSFYWRTKANFIWSAVPEKTEVRMFERELLKNAGIGLMVLDICAYEKEGVFCNRIYNLHNAKLYRPRLSIRWEQYICKEHAQNISGVQHADIRVSRYKLMMEYVRHLLKYRPEGMRIDELVKGIDTYYVNPEKGLFNALKKYESHWCESFKVPGDRKTWFRIIPGVVIEEKIRLSSLQRVGEYP